MQKAFYAAIILFFLPFFSNAQNNGEVIWTWTGTYGNGTDNSVANHLLVDDDKNLYVAGIFRGELIIEMDSIWGNPNEDRVFVSKFDSNGVLLWLRKVDWGYYVNHMRLDSDNDLRILCNSTTMIVYEGLTGTPLTYYPVPNTAAGNPGSPEILVVDFELDSDDNMYALYKYENSQTWVTETRVEVFATPNDVISANLWATSFECGFFGPTGPSGISIDTNRNVYVSGTTDGYGIGITGNTITATANPGVFEMYSVKYDAQGNALWATSSDMLFAEILGMELNTIDSSLYLTGYTVADEVLYGDTIVLDTTNQQQVFLLKQDLDGNTDWVKSFPLATKTLKTYPNASWGAMGTHLSVTDSGYVYLKGSFTGSIIFYNDTLIEDTSNVVIGQLADDVFIAKLDMNGNPIWGKYAGNSGGLGYETGDFWVDPAFDILYLVGYWASPNNLFKNSIPANNVKGIFIGKEGEPSSVSVDEIETDEFTLLVYPNPSDGVYYISKPVHTSSLPYQVSDLQGNIILSGEMKNSKEYIDLSNYSTGMYFFQTKFGSTKLLKN